MKTFLLFLIFSLIVFNLHSQNLQPATILNVEDVHNTGYTQDIQLTFQRASDETNITHYRVFAVTESASYDFNETTALSLAHNYYTEISVNNLGDDNTVTIELDPSEGVYPLEFSPGGYGDMRIFVMSYKYISINSGEGILSDPSESFELIYYQNVLPMHGSIPWAFEYQELYNHKKVEVVVEPGTYSWNHPVSLNFDVMYMDIVLRGNGSAAEDVIIEFGSSEGLFVTSGCSGGIDKIQFRNLTINNGFTIENFIDIHSANEFILENVIIDGVTVGGQEKSLIKTGHLSALKFSNVLIVNNHLSAGGEQGYHLLDVQAVDEIIINNTTIAGNTYDNFPGLIGCENIDRLEINNSIIRHEGLTLYAIEPPDVAEINYSNINNISENIQPVFDNCIDEPPLFESGAFRLQCSSPCLNTGNNDLVPTNLSHDIEGNMRILGDNVDMGAYEKEGFPNVVVTSVMSIVKCRVKSSQFYA